jgi:transcriptional regulator with XRE-family HTH domain
MKAPNDEVFSADLLDDLLDEIESSEEYEVVSAKSDIALRIYDRMEELGVSRAELARRLGKSRAYISKFLGGGTNVTVETLISFARALECHYSKFIAPPASEEATRVSSAIATTEPAPMHKMPQLRLVSDSWVMEKSATLLFQRLAAPCEELEDEMGEGPLVKVA